MASPKLFSITLLAASALAISTPALADTKTKLVGHSDLDLSSSAGQQQLKVRVKQAIKQVCGGTRAFTLSERRNQSACEENATASAMPKVERTIAAYADQQRLASRRTVVVAGN